MDGTCLGAACSRAAKGSPSSGLRWRFPPAIQSLRRDHSLKRASDFRAIRRSGRSWADRLLVLAARPRDRQGDDRLLISRFGFSASRRRIGNAVECNRVKRRLRAIVRDAGIEAGWDVLLIARRGVVGSEYSDIERSLSRLLRRAGIRARRRELE
ncbi:MAG: ribonuclease P protein component [Dehalococcoidia bacterium]|nr:ribonuclease P protein component [Dehalococcoidia bacterium]